MNCDDILLIADGGCFKVHVVIKQKFHDRNNKITP